MTTMWNPDVESMRPREMADYQQAMLNRQLEYLWSNSDLYAKKWSDAGVKRSSGIRLQDLSDYPLTRKAELRRSLSDRPPLGYHQAAPLTRIIRIHTSSGTTGQPTYMAITKADQEMWTESISRVFWASGMRPDDVYAHGLPIGMYVGGIPLQDAVENVGATFFSSSPGGTERLIEMMKHLNATFICSTPSYARRLTDVVRDEFGMEPRELGLTGMALGAEPGTELHRPELSDAWGCSIVETAGNSDVVPLFYSECERRDGMHMLAPDYLYTELVDPRSGERLEIDEGAEGGLVYTALEREASPLFRFESNDHVAISGVGECSCGRTTPRLRIVGRYDDMLIVSGLNVFPSAIDAVLSDLAPELTTGDFRIVREGDGVVEPQLRLRVAEPRDGLNNDDKTRIAGLIADAVKARVGCRPMVELEASAALRPSEFKTQYVESGS